MVKSGSCNGISLYLDVILVKVRYHWVLIYSRKKSNRVIKNVLQYLYFVIISLKCDTIGMCVLSCQCSLHISFESYTIVPHS